MRSLICVLLITICCLTVYINAAALPQAPENGLNEPEAEGNIPDDVEQDLDKNADGDITPQPRTLFLLLPLLFPDQFYFS